MDPLSVRVDTAFSQALRCIQYRLPASQGFQAPGYMLALGVRYGMVGIAASHYLLLTAEDSDRARVLSLIEGWPAMVEEHVRWEIGHRLAFTTNSGVSHLVGRISAMPLNKYPPLFERLFPLTKALERIGIELTAENRAMICEGWRYFRRRSAMRAFQTSLSESRDFAVNFFERREADIEEVPEIALIGE